MNKKDRELIFNKYGGKCAYCGSELTKGWHADHIEPIVRNWKNGTCEKPENEKLENYNPSCPSCNIQKNSYTLEQFRENIKQFVTSAVGIVNWIYKSILGSTTQGAVAITSNAAVLTFVSAAP